VAVPVKALKKVPLFHDFSARELERLSVEFHERTFPEGSAVTVEGKTGVGFFFIAAGNANITVGGEAKGTLGPGDYFGEMALIDDEGTRTATITAATDLRCYGLTPWQFRPFVEEHPQVAWTLLKTLAKRVRAAQAS
jgi:CRP/FNR family cyclic AMP-dependent transcriptional regulator